MGDRAADRGGNFVLDLAPWLSPIDGANPSGASLRDDPRFHEIERLMQPRVEVVRDERNNPVSQTQVPVDWADVLARAEALRAEGRDLRLLVIVARALGNVLDRLFRAPLEGSPSGFMRGAVVDFIDVQWWPIWNVADMAVVVGAIALALFGLRGEPEAEAELEAVAATEPVADAAAAEGDGADAARSE